jgi:hypothetical protein
MSCWCGVWPERDRSAQPDIRQLCASSCFSVSSDVLRIRGYVEPQTLWKRAGRRQSVIARPLWVRWRPAWRQWRRGRQSREWRVCVWRVRRLVLSAMAEFSLACW